MKCTNCGTENASGARFCSNCGRTLSAPAAATTPPANVPAAPPGRPASPGPAGGGGMRVTPAMLAIGGGALAVLIGLLVWALVFKGDGDEPGPVLPVATASASPSQVGDPSPASTGATGATGVTGVTAATGPTGETAAPLSYFVEICEDVTTQGSCVNGFPFDPASGWTIDASTPSFTPLLTFTGLQPGDVITITYFFTDTGEEGTTQTFEIPPEVVDFESWAVWPPPAFRETGTFPAGGAAIEMVIRLNGEVLGFEGPLRYRFV